MIRLPLFQAMTWRKSKWEFQPLAVITKSRTFFIENDLRNLNDDDFPMPGYLLIVSGHMLLTLDEKINYNALNEGNYVVESLTNSEPNLDS